MFSQDAYERIVVAIVAAFALAMMALSPNNAYPATAAWSPNEDPLAVDPATAISALAEVEVDGKTVPVPPQVRRRLLELFQRSVVSREDFLVFIERSSLDPKTKAALRRATEGIPFLSDEHLHDLGLAGPLYGAVVGERIDRSAYTLDVINRGEVLPRMVYGRGAVMKAARYDPKPGALERIRPAFRGRSGQLVTHLFFTEEEGVIYTLVHIPACNNLGLKAEPVPRRPVSQAKKPESTADPAQQPTALISAPDEEHVIDIVPWKYGPVSSQLRSGVLGRQSRDLSNELKQAEVEGRAARHRECLTALVTFHDFKWEAMREDTLYRNGEGFRLPQELDRDTTFEVPVCKGRGWFGIKAKWIAEHSALVVHLPKTLDLHYPASYRLTKCAGRDPTHDFYRCGAKWQYRHGELWQEIVVERRTGSVANIVLSEGR